MTIAATALLVRIAVQRSNLAIFQESLKKVPKFSSITHTPVKGASVNQKTPAAIVPRNEISYPKTGAGTGAGTGSGTGTGDRLRVRDRDRGGNRDRVRDRVRVRDRGRGRDRGGDRDRARPLTFSKSTPYYSSMSV